MGLRASASKAIAKAFDTTLADAVKSFIYQTEESTFNPADNTTSIVTADYMSRGVFDAFKESIVKDESVLDTRVKVIILKEELEVVPVKNANIITEDATYTIECVMVDPADVAWTLKCRE